MAAGDGISALDPGAGTPAHAQGLESFADHHRFQLDHFRHLSHALRHPVFDTRFFRRTGGRVFSRVSRRYSARLVRLARLSRRPAQRATRARLHG